ncbi:MAG TPA: hypothetical protein DCY79_16625 [Planctomycetaceae bacterium]|nr:hypothetical protein [Planctomycetaceae bacterium]
MSRYHVSLVVILCMAFAVRLAAATWWQARLPDATSFAMPDSESYWYLGTTVAHGKPYQFGTDKSKIFRAPGLPVLLGCLFVVTQDEKTVWPARLWGCVFGTATVAAIMWLARLLFDSGTSLVAGLLATFYPGGIVMSIMILSESPFCLLMVLHLICWTLAWKATGRRQQLLYAGLGGLIAGLGVLTRPSWLLLIPFALLIAVALGPRRKDHLAIGGAMLLGLVIIMTPWWVRNYRITGHLVPTTLQVGASLYDGLNPQATGASNMDFVAPFYTAELALEASAEAPLPDVFEYRLDRRMRDAAVTYAREHPGRAIQLAGIKLVRMWNLWPNANEFGNLTARLVVLIGYLPLLCLALCGVYQYARRDWPYLLCCLPAIYFTCLHMIFVSSIRYRQPAMLVLIVLAAAVAARWLPGLRPFARGEEA